MEEGFLCKTHPMKRKKQAPLSAEEFIQGILAGDRLVLSRAITLIESRRPTDRPLADQVLRGILPHTGNAIRIGITGVPGVGKSTFIEQFGMAVCAQGHRVAVLAIDPSSGVSGGSILGDKTRMELLSQEPNAYIRPTPAGKALGGVGNRTREALLLCEAAGFDILLIETVGVGQSETLVHGMTDFFLLLMLAGAGDQLQGIKRGIMEMADALVITKADSDNLAAARKAATNYRMALHLFPPRPSGWVPRVQACSALEGTGIQEVWELVQEFTRHAKLKGAFEERRREQNTLWLRQTLDFRLQELFENHPAVKNEYANIEDQVRRAELPADEGARLLLDLFLTPRN
jgi:LAO/AO transport system kinase